MQLPAPTMLILLSAIVATNRFELVYVIKPLLFELGGVILKATSPNVFVIAEKLVRSGVAGFTVRVAVIVSAEKLVVAA